MINDADFFDFLVDNSHVYVLKDDYMILPIDEKEEIKR